MFLANIFYSNPVTSEKKVNSIHTVKSIKTLTHPGEKYIFSVGNSNIWAQSNL